MHQEHREIKDRHPLIKHGNNIKPTEKIAMFIVNFVGTFPFFVACIILTFIPFVKPGLTATVQFISSALLQLILLPLIMIASNVSSRAADIRAENNLRLDRKQEEQIELLLKEFDNIKNTIKEHGISK